MSKKKNEKEDFEMVYEKNRRVYKELENLELAYVKIKEKYENQKDCLSLLEYIKTLEKVFTEAKIRNWNAEQSKKELIKAEIEHLAQVSNIDVEIFEDLYDSFQKTYVGIGKIVETQEKLSQKHQDCLDCLEFINYVTYLYINFDELQKRKINAEDLKTKLISARMDVLSSDGTPSLVVLEGIYKEFKQMLSQ
jgi:hypothetical protein